MAHKMPHTTGNSTKYKADVHLAAVDAFIAGGWRDFDGAVWPMIKILAHQLGVTNATMLNWCKVYPEFAEKYEQLKDFCEISLVQGGLGGKFETPLAIRILAAKYGYTEKTQVDNTSSDRSMSPAPTIDPTGMDDKLLEALDKHRLELIEKQKKLAASGNDA